MQKPWWKEAKIYELYVDKFADTFEGLTAELDYFDTLGVNTLHLLPHYPSPMVDDGYDVTDYKNVRPELGTLDDFKRFIAATKEKNIRVIIDWPFNHTSIQHPWFAAARLAKGDAMRDFYLWSDTASEYAEATNAFPDIKQSDWVFNPPTEDYYFSTFYPEQADLNWDSPEVFREITGAMDFWAALGISGFRLDAAPYLIKRDGTSCKGLPETHAVIKRIRAHLEERFPEVILIGEAHQDLALAKEYFGNGDECHVMYHFGLMEQMWLSIARGDMSGFTKMIRESEDIPENCQWAVFLRNHDEISLVTLSPEDRAALIKFLDPHKRYLMEKMGLTSMRVAEIFDGQEEKVKNALSLLYSAPGVPVTYYGDEIGMRNLEPEQGVIDTRKYVRGRFDRERAKLQMQDPQSLFNEVARMLRKTRAEVVHVESDDEIQTVPATSEEGETSEATTGR